METKVCQNCKNSFNIEPDDFSFYEKIKVPPPTWCPYCRTQRRLIWRNERTLYQRECSLCNKSIVAMYPRSTIFPVYCRECWFSDNWDPLSYGKDYDFSKPFFVQFKELLNIVPQLALQVSKCVDSEYINQTFNCKNCCLITSGTDNEDCMYSNRLLYCKNVVDCFAVHKLENSYEAIESREGSNLFYSLDCHNSFDCVFCFDVRNSSNCFMSSNLRSKSYVWYNEQLTKEGYQQKIKTISLSSYKNINKYKEDFEKLKKQSVVHFSQQKKTENCTGNIISNAKNAKNCFYVGEVENVKNLLFVDNSKESYDVNNGCCVMECMYEVNTTGVHCANVSFSSDVWPEVRNTAYSVSSRDGVNDIFGCISLRKKSNCILNKEYSSEEYKILIDKIIEHMSEMPYIDELGKVYKYGEFFPLELSPFAFNESAAFTYTPLTKDQVNNNKWRWKDIDDKSHVASIKNNEIPDSIDDIQDTIFKETIECQHIKDNCEHQCTKAFRILESELSFYRKMRIAVPRICPNCRHYERVKYMSQLTLNKRQCMCDKSGHEHEGKCQNEFETSHSSDRPEIVYCESCYQQEVV
ncbi:MAG: hypothetical protein AAB477_01860 [Patescibacteria group bacterium]